MNSLAPHAFPAKSGSDDVMISDRYQEIKFRVFDVTLEYLERAAVMRHDSFRTFEEWRRAEGRRLVLAETDGATALPDFAFRPSDIVMVGRESAGVTAEVRNAAGASLHIPMRPGLRSINVALAAAMVMGEALRQTGGFPGRQEADRTDHEHAPPR